MYAIPFIGWFLGLFLHISLAVPFWFVWTKLDIGKTFFYFLPEVYTGINFWNCVGLFICLSIIKGVIMPSCGLNINSNK